MKFNSKAYSAAVDLDGNVLINFDSKIIKKLSTKTTKIALTNKHVCCLKGNNLQLFEIEENNTFHVEELTTKERIVDLKSTFSYFVIKTDKKNIYKFTTLNEPLEFLASDIEEIACGENHTLLKGENGLVYGFGCNAFGVFFINNSNYVQI